MCYVERKKENGNLRLRYLGGGGVLHEGVSVNGWTLPTRMTGHFTNLYDTNRRCGSLSVTLELPISSTNWDKGFSRSSQVLRADVPPTPKVLLTNSAKFSEIQRNSAKFNEIRVTFSEHSGNIQGTLSEHLLNI